MSTEEMLKQEYSLTGRLTPYPSQPAKALSGPPEVTIDPDRGCLVYRVHGPHRRGVGARIELTEGMLLAFVRESMPHLSDRARDALQRIAQGSAETADT